MTGLLKSLAFFSLVQLGALDAHSQDSALQRVGDCQAGMTFTLPLQNSNGLPYQVDISEGLPCKNIYMANDQVITSQLLKTRLLAETATSWELVTENYTCSTQEFEIRHGESKKIYRVFVDQACKKINFYGRKYPYMVARQLAMKAGLPIYPGRYVLAQKVGDCYEMTFDIYDSHNNSFHQKVVSMPCRNINFLKGTRHHIIAHRLMGDHDFSALYSSQCDFVVDPNMDYNHVIGSIVPNGQMQTVCFRPGRYENPIFVTDKEKLFLYAPEGRIQLRAHINPSMIRDGLGSGVLNILSSKDIVVDGFSILNSYEHTVSNSSLTQVSRAVNINRAVNTEKDSSNIEIRNSTIESLAKQTTRIRYVKAFRGINLTVKCYYFCVDGNRSSLEFRDSTFTQLHRKTTADQHPLLYTHYSNQAYHNSAFTRTSTGRGVISGTNQLSSNFISFTGQSQVSGFDYWLREPSKGIALILQGSYPTDLSEHLQVTGKPVNLEGSYISYR